MFLDINCNSQERFIIHRVTETPVIDGKPGDAVWNTIPSVDMVMLSPTSGISPTERSQFKICFNDEFIYVLGLNYDKEPDKIQSFSKKRDGGGLENDFFGILFDSFIDKENALGFFTTPSSTRTDMQVYNDGAGGFPLMFDWNTFWDVASNTNEDGWIAEMRIPLSSLRFQVINDTVIMGLAVLRFIPRHAEWISYPEISNEWGFFSWAKPSQYIESEITGVKALNPLQFSPYFLGGLEQTNVMNEDETNYEPT